MSKRKTIKEDISKPIYNNLTYACEGYADLPSMASNRDGRAWVVWRNMLGNGLNLVQASSYGGQWSNPQNITDEVGEYDSPCIACSRNGYPMIAWMKNENSKWIIQSSLYYGDRFGRTLEVNSVKGRARNLSLIAGKDNSFWVSWESYEQGRFKICLKEYKGNKWGDLIEITSEEQNAYNPQLALNQSGKVWITYSCFEGDKLDICLVNYDPYQSALGQEIKILRDVELEEKENWNSYPSVMCDAHERIWVAWQCNPNEERLGSYFGRRKIVAVCYDQNKSEQVKSKPIKVRETTVFIEGEGTDYGPKEGRQWKRNNYYPVFLQDYTNGIWLFACNSLEAPQDRRAWDFKASFLDKENSWTSPESVLLTKILGGDSTLLGRRTRPAIANADSDSIWLAWQGDNYLTNDIRTEGEKSNIFVSRIHTQLLKPSCSDQQPKHYCEFAKSTSESNKSKNSERVRAKRRIVKSHYQEYTLLWGNLHEHTSISRCWGDCSDGTFDDNYRYGIDVENYDFIALTDHCYDLYAKRWEQNRRAVQFYNDPPYFVALPALEWTLSGEELPPSSGHRNIVFASDYDAAKYVWEGQVVYNCGMKEADRIDKVWSIIREKGIDAVTIPHHTADKQHPMDWDYHDSELQPVVEMYQCRGSAEYKGCQRHTHSATSHNGCYVRDALERGYKLGFVASGDHNFMGEGITAVYVTDISQKGIVEALKARRCYATTGDRIFMDFRINGYMMGVEVAVSGKVHVTAYIQAMQPLKSIHVFRNKDIVFDQSGSKLNGKTNMTVEFTDSQYNHDSYYYLRVIQVNNEIAWSSPIWVDKG